MAAEILELRKKILQIIQRNAWNIRYQAKILQINASKKKMNDPTRNFQRERKNTTKY